MKAEIELIKEELKKHMDLDCNYCVIPHEKGCRCENLYSCEQKKSIDKIKKLMEVIEDEFNRTQAPQEIYIESIG